MPYRIWDNGVIRDATPEEIAEIEENNRRQPPPPDDTEDATNE